MITNIFLVGGIVSLIYFILKFIEMRFVLKENKSFKQIIIDTIIVFVSTLAGNFIVEKIDLKKAEINKAPAFTDGPGF